MAVLGAAGLRATLLLGGGSVAVAGAVAAWAVFAPVKTVSLPDEGRGIASVEPSPMVPDAPSVQGAEGDGTGSDGADVASADPGLTPGDVSGKDGASAIGSVSGSGAEDAARDPDMTATLAPDTSGTASHLEAKPMPLLGSDETPQETASTASEPAVVPSDTPEALTQPLAQPLGSARSAGASPDPGASPPAFDVVRVEPDGAALVAGRAVPGATVDILVDGAEVAQADADASGRFVALLDLPASDAPRLLTLLATGATGTVLPGTERVALAPTILPLAPGAVATAVATAPADADAQSAERVADASGSVSAGLAAATDDAAVKGSPSVVADAAATPDPATPQTSPTPPMALLLSDGGARVLQAEPLASGPQSAATALAPASPSQVSIDVISYTEGGEVLLSGRAGPGVVRLYLDNRTVQDVTVDRGAWTAQLAETAPGLYTLRADGLAADGTVTARFETPFKRETRAALASVLGRASLPASTRAVRIVGTDAGVASTLSVAASDVAATGILPEDTGPSPDAAAAGGGGTASATSPPDAVAAEPLAAAGQPAQTTPASQPPIAGAAAPAAPATPVIAALSVTVQPGFTLWGIAQDRFGSGMMYVQVFEANRGAIRDPDLIYPGQVFALPDKS